jgi:signal peptidase I
MSSCLRVVAWLAVLGGAVCAIVYYAYADVWVVPANDPRLLVSVEPTLAGGDIVLVERHGAPGLGNLARCVDPDEPRRWVVGRLVGMSGGSLHLADQGFSTPGSRPTSYTACGVQKLVNPASGDEVELTCRNEEFAGMAYETLSKAREGGSGDPDVELRVPPGKSFLLSDDRYLHLDSRDYGSLPESSCHHVLFRLWGAAGFTDASRRFNIIW